MTYSRLRIDLVSEYPNGHYDSCVTGYYFNVMSENAKKIVEFAIECVRLRGGKCWVNKETVQIMNSLRNITGDEDILGDYHRVMEVVFNYSPGELLDPAEELWRSINK